MASAALVGGIPKLKEYLLVAANGPFKGYFVPKIDKESWDDEYRWYVDGISEAELEDLRLKIDTPEVTEAEVDQLAARIRLRSVNEFMDEQGVDRQNRVEWKFRHAYRIVQVVAVTPSLRDLVAAKSKTTDAQFMTVVTSRGNRYLVKRCDEAAASRPRLQISFASDNLQVHPGDFWQDISTTGLDNEGGVDFKNGKKPIKLIERALTAARVSGEYVMDYFAGSGTTVEAVMRGWEEKKRRSCVVAVESDHSTFHNKLYARARIAASTLKASASFKVLKIEGYEDTLNNLDLKRSEAQASLLEGFSADKRDDYLMRYMLDVEAKGSLLSVQDFRKPFDYTLKVAVDSAGAWEERKVDLVETFNYLIGLTVRSIDIQLKQGFVTVEGWLPTGEKTLILWRDCEKIGYEELTRLCNKLAINPADSEYDVVYLNGDHNIPSVVETTEEEGSVIKKLMLRQIEPAFLDAMFNVDDV